MRRTLQKQISMDLLWGDPEASPPSPSTPPTSQMHLRGALRLWGIPPFRHVCSFSLPGETMQITYLINQTF